MRTVVAIDFETHRFSKGILAPPPVCMSLAGPKGATVMLASTAKQVLETFLRGGELLAGANIAYDLVVAAAQWPDLLPLIFQKLERGEVFDVLLAQKLDAIAKGCFFKDPRTRGPLMKPPRADGKPSPQAKEYSLELVVYQVLGRPDAKVNDTYKLRYHELERVPLEDWPQEARQYPIDDAVNTREVALVQMGANGGPVHENLHRMVPETRAAFVLQLSAVYGLRTDKAAVDALEARLRKRLADALEEFKGVGLLYVDPKGEVKENAQLKKQMVARAYGATLPCPTCAGSGKVPSPKTGNPINCVPCSSTGLQLAPGTPRNKPTVTNPDGGICADRDTLAESGDDVLERYATVSEIRKGLDTYVPWLREGIDRPLCVSPHVIGAETLRTSYSGLIQLIPRKGGFRECFISRKGRVMCSVDYTAAELSTFSEVLLEIVGWSKMGEAINEDLDLHVKFAADGLLRMPYAEALAKKKTDPVVADRRQLTKEANFGFGGRMGPARFAGSTRKKGLRLCIAAGKAPECPDCRGEKGRSCRRCYGRGYLCGLKKVTEWGGRRPRPIPPTCVECIHVADDLREKWLTQWPEVREYFSWVDSLKDPYTSLIRMESPITGVVRGELQPSEASNHPFQHLAVVGAKEALWLIGKESFLDKASPLYGSRLLVFAHDESIMEHAEERAHEAGHRQAELMVEGMRRVVKRVKVKAEPALMRRWLKEAEPVYVDGRLVSWEPKVGKTA
jgi:hypothetical protein